MAEENVTNQYLIKRIEEILDAHQDCLTNDGTSTAGCVIYGDFESLVGDYYSATDEAQKPRQKRITSGPVLVA